MIPFEDEEQAPTLEEMTEMDMDYLLMEELDLDFDQLLGVGEVYDEDPLI